MKNRKLILALMLRTREDLSMPPWDKQYYLCDHYKVIFDQLDVILFPIYSANCAEEVCRICDGLIVPGSNKNIYPEYYGRVRTDENTYSVDEYIQDKPIVDAFVKAGKPIVGICAGIQVLNVFFGGTLQQLVKGHYSKTERHDIHIESGSFLHEVYGTDHASVNTYHSQCVDDVAPGFRVTARAEDGTIEAIENGNIIGVQWHPEVDYDMEFFGAFLRKFF